MDLKILKKIRKEQKISIKEMAKRTGLHRETIARIENGDHKASFENVDVCIGALNGYHLILVTTTKLGQE